MDSRSRRLPRVDVYSFSKPGEPWISSSWLAQILYAVSYNLAGWAGPVVVAAASIAATFGLLAHILERRIPPAYAALVALAAMVLSAPHFLARPHVLAMPVMVAWAYGLMTASERRQPPSFWLLPLIALWANLHGGFVFGLVLAGAFAIDALWNAEPSQRKPLALRWAAFGLAALAACCFTPYGWESILASRKILDLGELLRIISEWAPADFSKLSLFETDNPRPDRGGALSRRQAVAAADRAGARPAAHGALAWQEFGDICAAAADRLADAGGHSISLCNRPAGRMTFVSAAMLAVALGISTWALAAHTDIFAPESKSPAAAVELIKAHNLRRVLNDRAFGGYLIWRQMPVFIDGRAELYGEKFTMAYYNALELKDVNQFLGLLKDLRHRRLAAAAGRACGEPARSSRCLAACLRRRCGGPLCARRQLTDEGNGIGFVHSFPARGHPARNNPAAVSRIFPGFEGYQHEYRHRGGIQREVFHSRPGAGMAVGGHRCLHAAVDAMATGLLNDFDTYWQIAVGQWILDHHAMPRVDIYSFTKAGEPWISSSWLSQVLYATSYNLAGWTGPVVLAASLHRRHLRIARPTFSAAAFLRAYAVAIAIAALVLSMGHFLARPHVLVLPVMLVWAHGLLSASERGQAPSPWLLPVIALWANLHGGFVFGLVLVGAFALDALWNADRAQRKSLVLRWTAFGIGALVACCVTPYGWGSILAARKILDLGELLHLIYEWMPAGLQQIRRVRDDDPHADRRRAL